MIVERQSCPLLLDKAPYLSKLCLRAFLFTTMTVFNKGKCCLYIKRGVLIMSIDKFRVTNSNFNLKDFPTGASADSKMEKELLIKTTTNNMNKIAAIQDKLYADSSEGLVIIIQAMDAAGKDSIVKHVMTCLNPQGVDVHNFKQPSSLENSHSFMWRAIKAMPTRGKIAIFNRSYYEDVLVVKVHHLYKNQRLPKRMLSIDEDEFFKKRYKHIKNMEEYFYDEGYRVVKLFLNVSKKKQKERFLERIEVDTKNWKFSHADITERSFWNDYQKAYEDAIRATATKNSPWYIIPADSKWYTRYIVSEVVLHILEKINPKYPVVSEEQKNQLLLCKEELLGENK